MSIQVIFHDYSELKRLFTITKKRKLVFVFASQEQKLFLIVFLDNIFYKLRKHS